MRPALFINPTDTGKYPPVLFVFSLNFTGIKRTQIRSKADHFQARNKTHQNNNKTIQKTVDKIKLI